MIPDDVYAGETYLIGDYLLCISVPKAPVVLEAFRNKIPNPGCGHTALPERYKRKKTAMNEINEQTTNPSPSESKTTENPSSAASTVSARAQTASPGASNSKMTVDFSRFFNLTTLKDFLEFKIMIIPMIVKYVYLLLIVLCFFSTFAACARLWHGFGLVLFPLALILTVFVLHIVCEFFMLGFSILDTLRQIRNELIRKNEKNS